MAVEYKILVTRFNGTKLDEIFGHGLQYSFTRNDAGSISFSLPHSHPKANPDVLDPGKVELHLYRDGVLVWGGYLWSAQSTVDDITYFGGKGWWSRFGKRFVPTFTASGTLPFIAGTIIDNCQAGTNMTFGVTNGGIVGTPPVETYDMRFNLSEYKTAEQVIENLAKMDSGFDFYISPDKVWNTYCPTKGSVLPVGFEYGRNIKSGEILVDALQMANRVAGNGEGSLQALNQNTTIQAEYGVLDMVFGFKDIRQSALLINLTANQRAIRENKRILPQIQVDALQEPLLGTYEVGDTVPFVIDSGYLTIDIAKRIKSIVVAYGHDGHEAVGVYFDDEIE